MSTGWPAVEATCAKLGMTFDRWQEGAGRLILAKNVDGLYAADTVVISIPRQVGKTYLIGAIVFALCIIKPGSTFIWTAHRFKTAAEVFGSMSAMARRPALRPHIDPKDIHRSGDDRSITFLNDSRILFGARERGFGRGFADLDGLILDEAQILTEATMDDMAPATNVAENPLIIMTGTPPRPKDPGEVFTMHRREALSGEATDTLYIELSADPATDPMDRDEWRRFNPSYPHRTPERAMLRMRKNLSAESFEREGRGIWDADTTGKALAHSRWLALADARAERGTNVVFGLDLTGDRDVWIAVAWRRDDGATHVMLTNDGRPVAAYSAVAECKRLTGEWGGTVATSAFGDELEREGVPFEPVNGTEFAAACGLLEDAINDSSARHGNQPALNDGIKAARWRPQTTSGERAFVLRDAPEVGPVAAVARALWLLGQAPNYDPLDSIY